MDGRMALDVEHLIKTNDFVMRGLSDVFEVRRRFWGS